MSYISIYSINISLRLIFIIIFCQTMDWNKYFNDQIDQKAGYNKVTDFNGNLTGGYMLGFIPKIGLFSNLWSDTKDFLKFITNRKTKFNEDNEIKKLI